MLPGKTLTPADIVQMLRRRAWLIAIPPVITLFAALLYSSRIPNMYQSDMLIAIDPQRVPDAFVQSTVTLETDRRLDAISVQVLSRTNLEQMIDSLDLYPDERHLMPIEDVVSKMRDNITWTFEFARPRGGRGGDPTAFHVMFTYPDPNVAAEVTQQIGSLFVEQNVRERNALAGATNRFLETQLADSRKKLEQQEQRLETFRQRYGKELPTQLQSNMQALASAQIQVQSLVEAVARDRDRKQMLERLYREALAEPPVATPRQAQVQGDPSAPSTGGSAQQQLAAARASLTSLETRYKPDHPDVARARRLVAELEPKAAAEVAAQRQAANEGDTTSSVDTIADAARRERLREMRAEIESLDRQMAFKESEEQRVRNEIAEYQRRVEAVPGLESEWSALTRDYDTEQAAYKALLSKSTAAQVAANLEDQDIGERFRIVDEARVPIHPMPSARIRYNAGGLALGLLLGLGLAALLEIRDSSFRSDTDVLEVLGLPVLASVPRVWTTEEQNRRRTRALALSAAGAVCAVGMGYITWIMQLWKSLI